MYQSESNALKARMAMRAVWVNMRDPNEELGAAGETECRYERSASKKSPQIRNSGALPISRKRYSRVAD